MPSRCIYVPMANFDTKPKYKVKTNCRQIHALQTYPRRSRLRSKEFQSVVTENSVRSENAEVPIIREIMVATTMSSLFVALFALAASSFGTRAALQPKSSPSVTNSRFCNRTRRVACASTAATGCCGFCCADSGPVGGDVCRWFSPTRSSVGTAERSPGIGPGNRGAVPEGQKLQRTFVT